MRTGLVVLAAFVNLLLPSSGSLLPGHEAPAYTYDVVVYGGTAGGVMTAVSAAREGLKVALVSPDHHLGGMVSGGLGWTDYGRKEAIGGYSLEFFERVGKKYGRDIEWHFEPHVGEGRRRQRLS
jgi:NADPH-dependent 2,4-dienoyl-CoA reductase/sulfur reductase-like enzyme